MQPTDQTSTIQEESIIVRVWIKRLRLTGFGVALKAQHDLGCAVPSRGDVFRHVSGVFFRIDGETSGETKVADLQFAICVDQQVTRLQVSMEDIGRVNILQSAQDLIDEGLEMRVRQRLTRSDDRRQITLHQLYSLSATSSIRSMVDHHLRRDMFH